MLSHARRHPDGGKTSDDTDLLLGQHTILFAFHPTRRYILICEASSASIFPQHRNSRKPGMDRHTLTAFDAIVFRNLKDLQESSVLVKLKNRSIARETGAPQHKL